MTILNITGYLFVEIDNLADLKAHLTLCCQQLFLKGTILLSQEGINLSLAGDEKAITQFKTELKQDSRFSTMTFRESRSENQPFRCIKVKIKKEIITMRQDKVKPEKLRAPALAPEVLKQWLDENRTFTLLDTRNDYEIDVGTFTNAMNLHLKHFSEFPAAVSKINRDQPIVMFCTGGIRCEKAALYMLQEGYQNVYQLEGGILNYFLKVGKTHYQGDCFVFDERIALDEHLNSA